MATYINQATGEVYETENQHELVKKDMNEIVSDDLLEKLYQLQALEQQVETWKFQHKEQIKEIFKKYNIKSFTNDYMTITFVDAHKTKSVDTKKLKEAGLYDEFTKESEVKESVRIKVND